MRVVVLTASGSRVGGLETYLDQVMPRLAQEGHEVGLWFEVQGSARRAALSLPPGAPRWSVAESGCAATARAVEAWRPDVIFAHGTEAPALEAAATRLAPVAFLAHAFHSTCVSGSKAFSLPVVEPCVRRFGPACLAQYYPRRCGGLNPFTAIQLYRRTARRLSWVRNVSAVITLSEFMRREYLAHGIPASKVHCLPYGGAIDLPHYDAVTLRGDAIRLLFVGRLEPLKGGHLLIRALPLVASALQRPVVLTIAGDGRSREALQAAADRTMTRRPDVEVQFEGWLDAETRRQQTARAHLIVVPSVWPEPFGLVGLEAAAAGVPAAGFAVGGIGEWLQDGISGRLAPADPPTAEGLATAIAWCLSDDERYLSLRAAARRAGSRFPMAAHVAALAGVLAAAAADRAR